MIPAVGSIGKEKPQFGLRGTAGRAGFAKWLVSEQVCNVVYAPSTTKMSGFKNRS